MKRKQTLLPLLLTNFCGVANDNFLKTLAGFILLGWVSDNSIRTVLTGLTAAAFVLPYILVSPIADRLTALFAKQRIVQLAKIAELPIVALAICGFALKSTTLVIASIVIMGLQSALFSPAKYALVRDIGGESRIASGMGLMDGLSFLAVLSGTVLAAFAADASSLHAAYGILLALAAIGLVSSKEIAAPKVRNRELHSINPIRFFLRSRRMARRHTGLPLAIRALCVFWATAAMLQQGMLVYGTQVLRLDATHTGILLILAAIGIVIGQITAGFLDNRFALIGLVPTFGFSASALLAILYFAPLPAVPFGLVLGLLAFLLGFFKLPLDAEIQRIVKGPRLNTILAYFNQISFLYMFAASIAYAALGWLFGPRIFLLFLACVIFLAALRVCFNHRKAMLQTGVVLFAPRYRVIANPLPAHGPLLVLPNHPALIDPLLVLTTYRNTPLRPLVDKGFFSIPLFARALGNVNAIPVPDLHGRHTADDVAEVKGLHGRVLEALKAGDNVVLYPSGHIYTKNQEDIGNRQLAYTVIRDLPPNVTVVGLRTEGLWGSIWSRKGRKKSPSFTLTLMFGALLWPLALILPRRRVHIHAEDLTSRVRDWSDGPRRVFNLRLADWYNRTRTYIY